MDEGLVDGFGRNVLAGADDIGGCKGGSVQGGPGFGAGGQDEEAGDWCRRVGGGVWCQDAGGDGVAGYAEGAGRGGFGGPAAVEHAPVGGDAAAV